jgi:Ice-binding-like
METRIFILKAADTDSRIRRRIASYRRRTHRIAEAPESVLKPTERRGTRSGLLPLLTGASVLLTLGLVAIPSQAEAAVPTVGLGTAAAYSVLGGQAVTNTGPSTLSGDLGVSPGTAITGFPPGIVAGATYDGDAQAAQAQSDLVIGYNQAAGEATTASVAGDLVGDNFTSGVYKSTGPIALSGTLTLNGQGNPDSVFIFQIASTLITASASKVSLINGAQACNVFWQVGSSATLGTASNFTGTIMALTSITVTTDTTVEGRALARNGAVTLDDDTFTAPSCQTTTPPTTTTTTTATGGSGSKGSTTGGKHATTATTTVTGSNVSGGGSTGVGGGSGSGTNVGGGSGTGTLPFTGVSPVLMALFGLGCLLMLTGGLLLVFGNSERSRRLRRLLYLRSSTG